MAFGLRRHFADHADVVTAVLAEGDIRPIGGDARPS